VKRAVSVGAVLAGGRSERMGTSKALVELAGRPLAQRAVAAVGSAGLEPLVVAKPDTPLPRLDCRVLSEPSEPRHPLTGLLAALRAGAGRGIVTLACDMPFVPAKLIRWLSDLDEADVAVPLVGGRLEPLLARYSPAAAKQLERCLEEGDSIRDAVACLGPRIVTEEEIARFGDPRRIFFDVNSPQDLRRAERLLEGSPTSRSSPAVTQ